MDMILSMDDNNNELAYIPLHKTMVTSKRWTTCMYYRPGTGSKHPHAIGLKASS